MRKPTYEELAKNYQKWIEYFDIYGILNEKEFEETLITEKIKMLIECYGEEEKEEEEND